MFGITCLALMTMSLGCGWLRPPEVGDEDILSKMPFSGTASSSHIRLQSPDNDLTVSAARPSRETIVQDENKANVVHDVILKGNQTVPTHHLLRNIRTRPGRYFDPDLLQQDVNDLWKMKEVQRVIGPYIDRSEQGVTVTIEVVERQLVRNVQFVGNRAITDRALLKETGLTDGQPLDVHEIKMIKHRIEEFYHDKGFPRTQVEILEGNEASDHDAVFLIHEDQQQRIWKVEFEGNTIAKDGRLKTFIESKPSPVKVFGGLVKRKEIEQDVLRLTSYYRSLGFFNARIGREITESADGRWLNLRFIIDEGPRYRIRNISFIGNEAYTAEQLITMVDLKPTDGVMPEFNSAKMNQDVVSLRDLYGANGFVFSQVEVEPRLLEEPGQLDLVFKINEGKQYRVGNINVRIEGAAGITRREVVMNRLSLRPGDLIDVREIRNSERRLGSAQVFAAGDPGSGGAAPKIVVKPDELRKLENNVRTARQPRRNNNGSMHR